MIAEKIRTHAREQPNQIALSDAQNYTYRDLDEHSDILAEKFKKAGFEKGSKIIFAINFTTGSTGPAKGAVYTESMIEAMLEQIKNLYDPGPDSKTYSTLS